MAKVFIVLDNWRNSYFNKKGKFNYWNTSTGRQLANLIISQNALHISLAMVNYDFAYPYIPELNKSGQPKPLSKKKVRACKPRLFKQIEAAKPDVVIGMGQGANLALFGTGSITSNHGVPQKIKYGTQLIPTIVTFNIESTKIMPSKLPLIESDFRRANHILHHRDFKVGTNLKQYKYITDFQQVKQIMTKDVYQHPIVAVDTETNSLKPWNKGSKIIVFSLSWQEGHGVCIPLLHKQTPWDQAQIKQIISWLKALMMSKQYKVLHNGKYDIKFMMLTLGLLYATNCVDTLLMHYVGISEKKSISRGLKPLAIQFTSMGDYSRPLQDYKRHKELVHYHKFLDKYKRNRIKYKQHRTNKRILKSDYKPLHNPVDGGDFNYEWIPLRLLAPYAAADTDATLRLFNVFKHYIDKEPKWRNLIYNFYPQLENSLSKMEANGMHIDMGQVDYLKPAYRYGMKRALDIIKSTPVVIEFEQDNVTHLQEYETEMVKPRQMRNQTIIKRYRRLKGRRRDPMENTRFNPNSTNDVKQVLFILAGYQLPFNKDYMTTTAVRKRIQAQDWGDPRWMSVGKTSLAYCAKHYHSRFCQALLRYKKLFKLYNDFICKLPKMCDDKNRIHPKFIMSGTATHRLASRDPNAQNIPARTANPKEFNYHYPVKSMFTSRFDNGLVVNLDFKSFEIFVVASICAEPNLIGPLCNGFDIHKTNAARAFGVPYNKVTPDLRSKAKKVTFGTLYGITPAGLADQLHTSKRYATNLMHRVLGSLPVLNKYIKYVHQFVKDHQYVETLDGFRRRLTNIKSRNYSKRNRALRESLNAIVQGTTTYFIGKSIILIQAMFHKLHFKSKIVCTVHDSMVLDCPVNEVIKATNLAIYIMEHLPVPELNRFKISKFKNIPKSLWHSNGTFRFPLISNAGVGNNYNDLVKYTENELKGVAPKDFPEYYEIAYRKECLIDYIQHGLGKSAHIKPKLAACNRELNSLKE